MTATTRSGTAGLLFVVAALSVAATADAAPEMTVNDIEIDSNVVDVYIESRTQKPAAQSSAEERERWKQELRDIYLLTSQARVDELLNDPRVQAQVELQQRAILAQIAAGDFIDRNQASDEEILAEYTKQVELAPSQQYKARHILVETQNAAVALIEQLDDGANFEELAKSESTGPSGPNGGDLGWFSPEQMVKPFSDAVGKLENGQYTEEPVQTQFGWHVILREDSRAAEPPTLESVRDVIKQRVEQRKLQAYLQQLRELHDSE